MASQPEEDWFDYERYQGEKYALGVLDEVCHLLHVNFPRDKLLALVKERITEIRNRHERWEEARRLACEKC